jgi:hypothetical protein
MSEPQALSSAEDDAILAELWRIREEPSAEYGHDIDRRMADTLRLTFLFGNDVVTRSKSGEFEVVFKGTGKIRIDFDETAAPESPADMQTRPHRRRRTAARSRKGSTEEHLGRS